MKAVFVAIVKNESKCIRRCLESVRYICDEYIISDTGSTDDTIDVIKAAGAEFGMTGVVIQNEWVNYSHNRNIVMEAAYKTDCAYIVWNDADDYFVNKEGKFPTKDDAKELFEYLETNTKAHMIGITMKYCGSQYQRFCILRNNQRYIWKSPKHEYLTAVDNNTQGYYPNIINQGSLDGAARKNPDRQKKDVKLFIDYIYENGGPLKCTREVFYLAQEYSHFDVETAILYYKMFLELPEDNKNPHETYVTYIRLFALTKEVEYLTKAVKHMPRRLEAYSELVNYYNAKKEFHTALKWAMKAPEGREPHPSDMFSDIEVYHILFDLYYAVTLYWLGKYKSACLLNQQNLERNKGSDSVYLELLTKNQRFCISEYERTK